MDTLLFKLLTIQLIMKLTMTTILEGRTAHYVQLRDTPVDDDNDKRITCPVFSIRPAGETNKYIKYTVSAEQYNTVSDWQLIDTAITFKQCASFAASNESKMFLFDENECRVSSSLFTRLAEPCNNETATVVYMVEDPVVTEIECESEILVTNLPGPPCGSSRDLPVYCYNGIKYYEYVVSSTQFAADQSWTPVTGTTTAEDCAIVAASGGYKMFLMNQNECRVSHYLYNRLTEPCEDTTANVVYMIAPPETSCPNENLVIFDNEGVRGNACGDTNVFIICVNGLLFNTKATNGGSIIDSKGQCYSVGEIKTQAHEEQTNACAARQMQTCNPKDSDSITKLVQDMIKVGIARIDEIIHMDLEYDGTDWKWRNTDVVQPTDATGDWGSLLTPYSENPHAYISSTGLTNDATSGLDYPVCCQKSEWIN